MKIVYCIYQLGVGGGIERVLTNKVNYLEKQGYEISTVTCDYDGRPTSYCIDHSISISNLSLYNTEDLHISFLKMCS